MVMMLAIVRAIMTKLFFSLLFFFTSTIHAGRLFTAPAFNAIWALSQKKIPDIIKFKPGVLCCYLNGKELSFYDLLLCFGYNDAADAYEQFYWADELSSRRYDPLKLLENEWTLKKKFAPYHFKRNTTYFGDRNEDEAEDVILQHGADLMSELHLAAAVGDEEYIKRLISLEVVNLDAQNYCEMTALFYAVMYGYPGIVHLLLKAGINTSLVDDFGNRAQDIIDDFTSEDNKDAMQEIKNIFDNFATN